MVELGSFIFKSLQRIIKLSRLATVWLHATILVHRSLPTFYGRSNQYSKNHIYRLIRGPNTSHPRQVNTESSVSNFYANDSKQRKFCRPRINNTVFMLAFRSVTTEVPFVSTCVILYLPFAECPGSFSSPLIPLFRLHSSFRKA